jgi:putative type II/III system pilus formation protein
MRKARESSMALVFRQFVLALIFACCALAIIAPRAAPAADVTVILDQAKLLKMPERVASLVLGNPLIADVSLQPGGLMVVTGKGYGLTNLIALDRAGAVLMEKSIEVRGPGGDVVVVYRGIERGTYSCTPDCERRITLGDSNAYFEAIISETDKRNDSAQALATVK